MWWTAHHDALTPDPSHLRRGERRSASELAARLPVCPPGLCPHPRPLSRSGRGGRDSASEFTGRPAVSPSDLSPDPSPSRRGGRRSASVFLTSEEQSIAAGAWGDA